MALGEGSPLTVVEGGPLLRIGTLDGSTRAEGGADDAPGPQSTKYDLWLTRTDAGWALEAYEVTSAETAARPEVAGSIPLSSETAAEMFRTFSAARVPTADDAGQLVLRWGDHEWTADFHFADPPEREEANEDEDEENEGVRAFDAEPAPSPVP